MAAAPPPPPPPPPALPAIAGTPYRNRFNSLVIAPHPPKLPPHPNAPHPFIRPVSVYGPLTFPSVRPSHPSPSPLLVDHRPYQPNLQTQISVNQFALNLQQAGGPFIVPDYWPVEITGRPPTARGRVHAAPHQQVGDIGLLVFSPIDVDEFAINIFNVFTGVFLGSVACRPDDEFSDEHGPVRDHMNDRMHQGAQLVMVLTTQFSEGHVYGFNSTGYAQAAVYELAPPSFDWSPLPFASHFVFEEDAISRAEHSVRSLQEWEQRRKVGQEKMSSSVLSIQRSTSRGKLSSLKALQSPDLIEPRLDSPALIVPPLDSIWKDPRKRSLLDTDPSTLDVVVGNGRVVNAFARPSLLTPPGDYGSVEKPSSDYISNANLFGNISSRERKGDPNLPATRLLRLLEANENEQNRSRLAQNPHAQLTDIFELMQTIPLPLAVANGTKLLPPLLPPHLSPFIDSLGHPVSSPFWNTNLPIPPKPREAKRLGGSLHPATIRALGSVKEEEEEMRMVEEQMKECCVWLGVDNERYWEEMEMVERRLARVEKMRESRD